MSAGMGSMVSDKRGVLGAAPQVVDADAEVPQAELPHGGKALPPLIAWSLAIGATLTMAVSYFDRQVFAVLSPTIMTALGLTKADYGYLISAFSLAYLVAAPLSGVLIDRVGARRGLLGAVIAWSIVAALHALAPSFAVLFALRLALGVTESPSFPGATQTVHRALPPVDRARGFGILYTGTSLGAMIAGPIAARVAGPSGTDWRTATLVTAAGGLIWVPMWFLVAYNRRARAVLDHPGEDKPKEAGGLAAIKKALSYAAVQRVCVIVIAASPIVGFSLFWSPAYLAAQHHVSQVDIGTYLVLPPLLFDGGAILMGHLASRHLRRTGQRPRFLFAVASIMAASIVALPFAPSPEVGIGVICVAMIGLAGVFTIFTSDVVGRVPASLVSTVGGIIAGAQALVYVFANPLIGRAIDVTKSYMVPCVGLAALLVPGVLVWLFWNVPAKPVEGPARG